NAPACALRIRRTGAPRWAGSAALDGDRAAIADLVGAAWDRENDPRAAARRKGGRAPGRAVGGLDGGEGAARGHCRSRARTRRALTALEVAVQLAPESDGKRRVDDGAIDQALQHKALLYGEDEHYLVVSAFIKSMRGSDPDAALYWMMRMLEAGDDPLFVLRR